MSEMISLVSQALLLISPPPLPPKGLPGARESAAGPGHLKPHTATDRPLRRATSVLTEIDHESTAPGRRPEES